jgi:two-component system chemotaxis response regulator CheB
MPGHDIIVVGTSAGGVEALMRLARDLPADLPAAVFVVLHVPASGTSMLPLILSRHGPLPATHAKDGEPIRHGHIYVAPPDEHLLIKNGTVQVVRGPRENCQRPAVDPLFRTAARGYGRRVVGVVLTGFLDDGTAGLAAVKRRGGVAIVQDPDDALFEGMPRSALENVAADYVLPLAQIAPILVRLAHEPVAEPDEPVPSEMDLESEIAELNMSALANDDRPGEPSVFTCPECHGTLWELRDGELVRYRCRVGHAYSADSLLAEQAEALEAAIWTAFRALKERAAMARRMADRARGHDHRQTAVRFESEAEDAEQRAALIQQVLLKERPAGPSAPITTDAVANPPAGPEREEGKAS